MMLSYEKLAKQFSEALLKEIGDENMYKVIELNSKENDKNICHSHDFCDANQVMLDTMCCNKFDKKMNKVWDIAKQNNFFMGV